MQVKTQTDLWSRKLWAGFVFLMLGFGVNAWAACEAEIEAQIQADCKYDPRNDRFKPDCAEISRKLRSSNMIEYYAQLSPENFKEAEKLNTENLEMLRN